MRREVVNVWNASCRNIPDSQIITLVATGCSSSVRFFGFAPTCTMFVFLLI